MRSLAGSALLLVGFVPFACVCVAMTGMAAVLAEEPVAIQSHSAAQSDSQAMHAPCAAPAHCPPRSEANEPGRAGPAQSASDSVAQGGINEICAALATAAAENDLPSDFLARLVWQESRFDPAAVSRAGAQGVAQFMPGTAIWRGVADPFDPVEAITKAATLLRDLRREFGNLALAAAAYNAGAGRVRDWLAGRRELPRETRAYVRVVTGRSIEHWAQGEDQSVAEASDAVPCTQIAALLSRRSPAPQAAGSAEPWGVELVGGSSDATALAAYRLLQRKYGSVLSDREPRIVHHGLARGSLGWARVRIGADSRANAERLCGRLRAVGASCYVERN